MKRFIFTLSILCLLLVTLPTFSQVKTIRVPSSDSNGWLIPYTSAKPEPIVEEPSPEPEEITESFTESPYSSQVPAQTDEVPHPAIQEPIEEKKPDLVSRNPKRSAESLIQSLGYPIIADKLSSRGMLSRTTNLYIDGVLANDPLTGEADLSILDSLSIQDIRVVEGFNPTATQHTVSIYVTTDKQPHFTVGASTSVDTTDNLDDGLWFAQDNSAWLSSSFSLSKVSFSPSVYLTYDPNPHPSFGTPSFWVLVPGSDFAINTSFGLSYSDVVSLTPTYQTSKDFSRFDTRLSVDTHSFLAESSFVALGLGSNSPDDVFSSTSTLSYTWKLPLGFSIKPSGTFRADYYNNIRLSGSAGILLGWQVQDFSLEFLPFLSWYDCLAPTFGGRLSYTPGSFSFGLSAYQIFLPPNLTQLFWRGYGYSGNPNLSPESGFSVDLTLGYTYSTGSIFLKPYLLRYTGSIHAGLDPMTNQLVYRNQSDGTSYGFSLTWEHSFTPNWSLLTRYENANPYISSSIIPDKNAPQIMWTARHTLVTELTYNSNLFSGTLNLQYLSKRPYDNTNRSWLPASTQVGFSVSAFPTDWLTITFSGRNVLADLVPATSYTNLSPRSFSLSAEVSL